MTQDDTTRMFDRWAANGYSMNMQRAHTWSVTKFLESVDFAPNFSILDVGCGNGWVVRRLAGMDSCRSAVGIDPSSRMIELAQSRKKSGKERYHVIGIESVASERFDYAFSMESLYYVRSVDAAVRRIYELLEPGGSFFCGTDFYAENKATAVWAKRHPVQMHLLSRNQWVDIFRNAGFETTTTQICNDRSNLKWMREYGTLFIIGKRPEHT